MDRNVLQLNSKKQQQENLLRSRWRPKASSKYRTKTSHLADTLSTYMTYYVCMRLYCFYCHQVVKSDKSHLFRLLVSFSVLALNIFCSLFWPLVLKKKLFKFPKQYIFTSSISVYCSRYSSLTSASCCVFTWKVFPAAPAEGSLSQFLVSNKKGPTNRKAKLVTLSQTSWLREEGDPQLGCVLDLRPVHTEPW